MFEGWCNTKLYQWGSNITAARRSTAGMYTAKYFDLNFFLQHKKKSETNGGCGSKLTELPSVNGGDANLNLSEDSSEDGEEEDKSMFDEKAGEDKTEKGNNKEKAVKRKRASELEADEEAKRSSVN